jgi:restriction endonuclease Mrr
MAVPDYQSVMLPLLPFAAKEGTEVSTSEAVEALAKKLQLTEDDLKEMLPSRIQSTFDVMQFAGALQAQRATKGIFITTSRFTDDALRYISQIGSKIVLIDGEQLTNLMIEHDVGVSTVALYPVKKVDSDYFDESI